MERSIKQVYLHLSSYTNGTFLAVIADEPILKDGRTHNVLDYNIVESRGEAYAWYDETARRIGRNTVHSISSAKRSEEINNN